MMIPLYPATLVRSGVILPVVTSQKENSVVMQGQKRKMNTNGTVLLVLQKPVSHITSYYLYIPVFTSIYLFTRYIYKTKEKIQNHKIKKKEVCKGEETAPHPYRLLYADSTKSARFCLISASYIKAGNLQIRVIPSLASLPSLSIP